MKVQQVIQAIEALAPPGYAYSWDRVGLHTGRPDQDVHTALVALTVTQEVLDAALQTGAEMVVSHHPLIWEPFKSLREDYAESRLALDIARARIACYAAHTNLDVVPGGVNTVLAERLGLIEIKPLLTVVHADFVKLVTFVPQADLEDVRTAICEAGAGVIGDYSYCTFATQGVGTFLPGENASPYSGRKHELNEEREIRLETLLPTVKIPAVIEALVGAHPYEEPAYDLFRIANPSPNVSLGLRGRLAQSMLLREFASHVCDALEIPYTQMIGAGDEPVQEVAVLGGAGGSSVNQIPLDVDVYVTGDVKYHEAISAREKGLAVIDAGHHGTEKWIVPALVDYLEKTLPDLRVVPFMEAPVFELVQPKSAAARSRSFFH
ncbi:MAG: Nif3-like dinuclear metal center hexameric protein [Candidatus Hydrogenedentales bacterium]